MPSAVGVTRRLAELDAAVGEQCADLVGDGLDQRDGKGRRGDPPWSGVQRFGDGGRWELGAEIAADRARVISDDKHGPQ